ncbi:hypothetical protein [Plantactinospora sp. GCM10030261]|uniref:hypothetical protein n=1 Tax=Plantactinospora sp. GCM10030261 TaxID=3273420 RepID=UPI003619AC89
MESAPFHRQRAEPLRRESAGTARPECAGDVEDDPGYVIHLPVRVGNVDSALRLARAVAGALDFLPELDPGETTVSMVDDQNNRRRVFCDLLLPDRSRCPQWYAHRGPCGPGPAAPTPAGGR